MGWVANEFWVALNERNDLLSQIEDPFARRKIMDTVDSAIEKLYDEMAQDAEMNVKIDVTLSGIDLLRYRVLLIFLADLAGASEDECVEFLFRKGILEQVRQLGLARQLTFEETDVPVNEDSAEKEE